MSRLAELGIAKRLGRIVLTGVVALVALAVIALAGRPGANQTRQAGAEVARTAEELRGLVGAFRI